jgi:phage shock protein A
VTATTSDRLVAVLANVRNDAIAERGEEILRLFRADAQRLLAEQNPDGAWAHVTRYPDPPAAGDQEILRAKLYDAEAWDGAMGALGKMRERAERAEAELAGWKKGVEDANRISQRTGEERDALRCEIEIARLKLKDAEAELAAARPRTDALYDVLGAARGFLASFLREEHAERAWLRGVPSSVLEVAEALQRLRDTLHETRRTVLAAASPAPARAACNVESGAGHRCCCDPGHPPPHEDAHGNRWVAADLDEKIRAAAYEIVNAGWCTPFMRDVPRVREAAERIIRALLADIAAPAQRDATRPDVESAVRALVAMVRRGNVQVHGDDAGLAAWEHLDALLDGRAAPSPSPSGNPGKETPHDR